MKSHIPIDYHDLISEDLITGKLTDDNRNENYDILSNRDVLRNARAVLNHNNNDSDVTLNLDKSSEKKYQDEDNPDDEVVNNISSSPNHRYQTQSIGRRPWAIEGSMDNTVMINIQSDPVDNANTLRNMELVNEAKVDLNISRFYSETENDISDDEVLNNISSSCKHRYQKSSRERRPWAADLNMNKTAATNLQSSPLDESNMERDVDLVDQPMIDLDVCGVPKTDKNNQRKSILKHKCSPISLTSKPSTLIDNYNPLMHTHKDLPNRWDSNEQRVTDESVDEYGKDTIEIDSKKQGQVKINSFTQSPFYIKERDILNNPHHNMNNNDMNYFKPKQPLTGHDRVRMEALEMLEIAGGIVQEENIDHRNKASRLRMTPTGGYTAEYIDSIDQKSINNALIQNINNNYNDEEVIYCNGKDQNLNITSRNSKKWGKRHSVNRHIMTAVTSTENSPMLPDMHKEIHINNVLKVGVHLDQSQERPNPAVALNNWLEEFRARRRQHELDEEELVAKARVEKIALKAEAERMLLDRLGSTEGKDRRENNRSNSTYFRRFHQYLVSLFSPGQKKSSNINSCMDVNLTDKSMTQKIPPSLLFSADDDIDEECKIKRRYQYVCLFIVSFFVTICIGYIFLFLSPSSTATNPKNMLARYNIPSVGEVVSFYLLSNTPFTRDDETTLKKQLKSLGEDKGSFLVHLGDVGLASNKQCVESVYDVSATLLSDSPLPVFILPGNNDWNDCPDPYSAWQTWRRTFQRFDQQFGYSYPNVYRQIGRDENFSFLYNGVLFIGIHLVDGYIQNEREWSTRHLQNVEWTEENLYKYVQDEYRAVVLMGHSPPKSKVGDYFWPIIDDWKQLQSKGRQSIPFLYVHANKYEMSLKEYKPAVFTVNNMIAAEVPPGGAWKGLTKVTINFGPEPFQFENFR